MVLTMTLQIQLKADIRSVQDLLASIHQSQVNIKSTLRCKILSRATESKAYLTASQGNSVHRTVRELLSSLRQIRSRVTSSARQLEGHINESMQVLTSFIHLFALAYLFLRSLVLPLLG